jgi:hypothetical protein
VHTHAVRALLGAEKSLQVSHASVELPETEKVPSAHASTRAFRVAEHCLVMRLPGEVTAQAWQVGSTELGLVAKKAPLQTHAVWSLLETEFGLVHAVQPEDPPVPSSEYVLATAQAVQPAERCDE